MSYPEYLSPAEMLAKAKVGLDLPGVAVICGSTRFMDAMADVDRALTWGVSGQNWIVVRPGCDMKTQHPLWADPAEAEAGKVRLDGLHRAKIRLADVVYIVCPGGYVGDSTKAEISYASSLGKPVRYVVDGDLTPLAAEAVS